MSNSLIPMGPSNQDKAEMTRLLQIMNGGEGAGHANVPAVRDNTVNAHYAGGYAGTQRPLHESRQAPPAQPYIPTHGATREDVDAMKNLLETINALSGEEPARRPVQESAALPAPTTPSNFATGSYTVLVSIQESNGKEVNRYSVVDEHRRDVVSNLVIKEAATAIMKLLNKGNGLNSAKVQEVVDLEETFNRNRIESAKHKERYNRSMQLGETSAANVFKDRFNTCRAHALAAQDSIKSINESLR